MMSKNIVEPDMPWRMRIAYWIPKAVNPHSVSLIVIDFPQQQ